MPTGKPIDKKKKKYMYVYIYNIIMYIWFAIWLNLICIFNLSDLRFQETTDFVFYSANTEAIMLHDSA